MIWDYETIIIFLYLVVSLWEKCRNIENSLISTINLRVITFTLKISKQMFIKAIFIVYFTLLHLVDIYNYRHYLFLFN